MPVPSPFQDDMLATLLRNQANIMAALAVLLPKEYAATADLLVKAADTSTAIANTYRRTSR